MRENIVTSLVGALIAAPLGYAMILGLAEAYDTELFRMPVLIRPTAVILTLLITTVFLLIVQWTVYRQVCGLNWLEGVKVKE